MKEKVEMRYSTPIVALFDKNILVNQEGDAFTLIEYSILGFEEWEEQYDSFRNEASSRKDSRLWIYNRQL